MKSLDEIKKENPFLVPDGYFDQLESEVMSKVKLEQKKVHRRRIYTISVAAAAVVALLVAINVWIFLPENNSQNTELADEGSNSSAILLASGSDYGVLSNGEALPAVDFEDSDLDNVDYQILDYYSDEMSQLDLLY
ncbi:MAG: hypothetical protein IKO62_10085 [Bacteroidales bacterium]|nr:hypothetical protein [Bacteroidales bacterium]